MKIHTAALAALLGLCACNRPAPAPQAPPAAKAATEPAAVERWLGRWNGPEGTWLWNDRTSPAYPDSIALTTATIIMPVMSRAQNRAIAAGSTISPTASNVPSAWKPLTKLTTTSARNAR